MHIPVRRNKSNNVAIKRDGKRIPYSSIESLERPQPAPNYGHNPRPGPPYPWENSTETVDDHPTGRGISTERMRV